MKWEEFGAVKQGKCFYPYIGLNFVVFGNNDFYVDGATPVEFDWYPDDATSGGFFRYQF